MIIAVDSFALSSRFANTGTYNYASNVLKGCLRIAESLESGVEFHAFVGGGDNWAADGLASSHLRVHPSRLVSRNQLWRFGGMALSTSLLRPDLIFLPTGQASIPYPASPIVGTVLDAMYMRLPPEYLGTKYKVRSHLLSWALTKLASRIITISHWSKKDLVDVYCLDPRRVEVIYLGYDKQLYNDTPPDPAASAALLSRLGVRKPFVLHHGLLELRKNVHRLIQAFDRVCSASKEFAGQLVLAGSMGYGYEEILKVRGASRNREQIILTGHLPDVELATLVKNASLCVIPSLYEGFCLPMVEAMACGIPTVASNGSCIPEVSRDVLEYFDPHSVEEIAEVIQRALEDSNLRDGLRDRGLARAAEFSWERCARETLAVFARVVARHG